MDTGSDYVEIDMKTVTVQIHIVSENRYVPAPGQMVKIGDIEDLFAVTPYCCGMVDGKARFLPRSFTVTHIPTGASLAVWETSRERAVKAAEKKLQAVGKENYVKAVRKAMRITKAARRLINTGTSSTMRKAA